ncbi:MAG TPA: hypothetical protein VFV95_19065 [Vicinamibacterales bacterium]|nr:hypothetical protein [Vicinamibacterales bacterium]
MTTDVSAEAVMADLRAQVRERIREHLLRHGASRAFDEPELFADVDALLRAAVNSATPSSLLIPELLGDPETWRPDTAMRYQSHRGAIGPVIVFVKRRLLMPVFRWLFEYSRDNFERQRRMNEVLCGCVQELAIETARLRREVRRLSQ